MVWFLRDIGIELIRKVQLGNRMKILHILASGEVGGIEVLVKDFTKYSKHKNIVMFLFDEGPLAKEIELNGIETISMHAKSNNYISLVWSMITYCKDNDVDVVIEHHSSPIAHLFLLIVKKFIKNIRTIAYAHANVNIMYREDIRKGQMIRDFIITSSLKKVDKIVAISQFVKDSLVKKASNLNEKISVIYNGVEISRFYRNREERNNVIKIIYVGRLIEGKGVQLIIEALKDIKMDYHFDVIGDGDYREELEKLVQQNKLQNRITFYGMRSDVQNFLANADFFIHVPLFEEGFGITIIEAMASGLICVCSQSGGIPEVIEHGSNGYLVNKNSVKDLHRILVNLLYNYRSIEQENIRNKAQQSVEKFSIYNFVNSLDEIIENIIMEK